MSENLSSVGLGMAGATSISNVIKDVAAKKVLERHEVIASGFWIRLFAALTFGIALAVTALVVFAGFRSVRVAILALLPNVVPIALTLGFMGWSGIALNTATVTVAGIALGLIVDDTIHFLYRYLLARKRFEPPEAVGFALFTMGKAAIVSSGAVAIGFALFAFSPFKPTAYFGLLIAITAISASICDLVFLPALLARRRNQSIHPRV